MPVRIVHRPVALALAGLLLASCATTNLPPMSATGAAFQPARDEVALWQEARVEEDKLLAEVAVYDDPLLEDYLEDVVSRLTPRGMAANPYLSYSVTVVEDPTLNAFAYPHGALFVHTGLLARMENEDQLATVLGHEMSHVEYRHMLRQRRSNQNKQIAFAAASLAAAVILANEEGKQIEQGDWSEAAMISVLGQAMVGLGLQLAFLASVNGYGRELELEADHGGFRKLDAAGYQLAEAPRVYEILLEGSGGDTGKVQTFFFGSHPRLTERIASAKEYNARRTQAAALAAEGGGGEDGGGEDGGGEDGGEDVAGDGMEADAPAPSVLVNGVAPATVTRPGPGSDLDLFRRRLRPVVRDDARMNLEAGRLERAEASLTKALDWLPEDPESQLILARLRLAEADKDAASAPQLTAEAREALLEAIRLGADRPEPHLELGLLHYRAGELADACREFGFYLDLAPDGEESPRVRDYLLELEGDGACS